MDQVRWKKARPGLAAEIRTHLLDQRDACLAQGMDEGAAQGEAARWQAPPNRSTSTVMGRAVFQA